MIPNSHNLSTNPIQFCTENPDEAENYSNDDLRNLIDEINEKLNKLEQKITIVRMEIQDEPEDFVVFCQTNESPVSK